MVCLKRLITPGLLSLEAFGFVHAPAPSLHRSVYRRSITFICYFAHSTQSHILCFDYISFTLYCSLGNFHLEVRAWRSLEDSVIIAAMTYIEIWSSTKDEVLRSWSVTECLPWEKIVHLNKLFPVLKFP